MKRHLYKDEIRRLLITYTIIFTLVSIFMMILFVGVFTNVDIRNKALGANETVGVFLTQEMESYIEFLEDMPNNKVIQDFFRHGQSKAIYEELYDFNNSREITSVFYIVDTNGQTVITNNNSRSPYDNLDIFMSGIFKEMSESNDIVFDNNKVQIDLSKRTVYSLGRAIRVDGELVGYLLFDLIEQDMLEQIQNLSVDIVVITDQYYNSILTNNASILDEIGKLTIVKRYKEELSFNNNDYYFYEARYLDERIRVFTFSKLDFINELVLTTSIFMILAMVVVIAVVVKISGILAYRKTKSIEDIINFIDFVKSGDLSARLAIDSDDEFEIIAEQLNQMLERMGQQMKTNEELSGRNKTAVIKQLEAQFNPHFIFNTLETLKYLIQFDREKSMEMIVHFANILRYSVDYMQENIYLKDDLDYLKSYLQIQKFRYNKRLTFQLRYNDELAMCIVPKLILQPIIENCIVHGYKKKEKLHIDIIIEEVDTALVMYVKDNGDGMTEDQVDQIMNHIDDEKRQSGSIGLSNVHRRLQLLYGETYGVKVTGIEGEGTTVVVRLPIQIKDSESKVES